MRFALQKDVLESVKQLRKRSEESPTTKDAIKLNRENPEFATSKYSISFSSDGLLLHLFFLVYEEIIGGQSYKSRYAFLTYEQRHDFPREELYIPLFTLLGFSGVPDQWKVDKVDDKGFKAVAFRQPIDDDALSAIVFTEDDVRKIEALKSRAYRKENILKTKNRFAPYSVSDKMMKECSIDLNIDGVPLRLFLSLGEFQPGEIYRHSFIKTWKEGGERLEKMYPLLCQELGFTGSLRGWEIEHIKEHNLISVSQKLSNEESKLLKSTQDGDVVLRLSLTEQALSHPGGEEHRNFSQTILKNALQFQKERTKNKTFRDAVALYADVINSKTLKETAHLLEKADKSTNWVGAFHESAAFCVGSCLWANSGFPVFDLTYDFFHAIAITDFVDVGEDELRLPFEGFILRFPENKILSNARTAFIHLVPIGIRINKEEGSYTYDNVDLAWKRARMTLQKTPELLSIYTDFPLGISLKEFITSTPSSEGEKYHINPPQKGKAANDALDILRRILANMMLYVNANGGLPQKKILGPEVPVEREHKEKPRFRLGRPIKLEPKVRQFFVQSTGVHWKLEHRFLVRGHWRNQACGTGRKEHKRIWIQPFFKGPKDLNEALERSYTVE